MKRFITFLKIIPALFLFQGMVQAQEILFTENFDYTPGPLPTNWTIDAEQPPEWSINNSQISGGTAPELYMGYGMQAGLSRLISPVIALEGHSQLLVKYKQYLINYAGDWGETIGMDVTFDGGTTWQPLWEQLLGLLNIPQDEFAYYITAPDGATEMQIAFRFEGNNMGINGWAIDDLIVESAMDNDLLISNIMGNTTPNAGIETTFVAEVQNGGKLTQTNYTVKLKNQEGEELASLPGEEINFTEKKFYIFPWTPDASDMGAHTIYATVELAQDQDSENNDSNNLLVNVLAQDTENVQIGSGSYPLQHAIPYNFFNLNSLSQTLYLSQDIGQVEESAALTGIQYNSQFDEDIQDVPVQIYLAETDQTDLSNDWVNPASFTLVYDGLMDFRKGFNSHYIQLDTPYEYTGGNLVVYSNKTYSEQILWSTFISTYHEEPIYSRMIDGAQEPYDAMNPPSGYNVWYTPNITLFFSSGEMSVIDSPANALSMDVYPNPAKEILNIKTHNGENILGIQLISSNGQVVSSQKVANTNTTINVRGLQPGFYLVQIQTESGFTTKKVIIN